MNEQRKVLAVGIVDLLAFLASVMVLTGRNCFRREYAGSPRIVEQIDGVIELNGDLYLVEMKWWNTELGPGDVSKLKIF